MIGALLRIRYELTAELDQGPVFTLYRAKDRVTGRDVNIRVLREPFSSETPLVDHLRNTVRELASIQAPSVERFIDVDDHEGTPFIVSESGTGQPFDERLKRLAPYSVPVAIGLAIQILESLSAVHNAGFVHGELIARHVLVGPDGKTTLLQPGLWVTYASSRLAGPAVLPSIAGALAPEVSQGRMPASTSDVYAMGVMLFEMLSGRQPFSGDTPIALASKHLTAPVPSLRTINPGVPVAVEEVVRKAMAKDPNERYANAKAMMADLRIIQDAVRFGKPLTWPLTAPADSKGASSAPAPAPAKVATAPAGKPYSPPKPEAPTKAAPDDLELSDRLPRWLTGIAYTFLLGMIVMVGGWVYWNLTLPKPIKVPDLVGMPVDQAKQQLQGMGLNLREGRKEFSERQPEGVILKLDPAPGGEVREGGAVSAVISAGSKFVTIPDLRGRSLDEAKTLLNGLDLQINEPVERRRSRQVEPGKVLSSVPDSRSKVERGSTVRLTVSAERGEAGGTLSDARGSYLVRVQVPRGIDPVTVRVDVNDVSGVRTVHEDRHGPGEIFEVETDGFGDPIFIKIYFDGDLVKSVEKSPAKATGAE